MSRKSLFAVFTLLGLMGIMILGLLGRQGELRDRVGELEQALRDARRPRARATAPEASAPLRAENDRLQKEVAVLKDRIVERKVGQVTGLLSKYEGAQLSPGSYDFPPGGGEVTVVHTGFIPEDALKLTDVQRARVSELEKKRDEELAAFDSAGPADDPNRQAFRKEIEGRWDLALKQLLDPVQQSSYDAWRSRGGGRLSDLATSERLVWRTTATVGDVSIYYGKVFRPLDER